MGDLAIHAHVSGLSVELCTLLGMRPASPLHFSPGEAVWEGKDLRMHYYFPHNNIGFIDEG